MKSTLGLVMVLQALLITVYGQTSGARAKTEFEAASIRVNAPRVGFHFASDSSSGGPGSTNPGMFRCPDCTLATLIGKAFSLQNYQFPGRSSLADNTFDVMARIPAGATQEEFLTMLQNLLKDRFGLAYHYKERNMRGFHLVVAKSGSKLRESVDNAKPGAAEDPNNHPQSGDTDQHRTGRGDSHSHNGLVNLHGSAIYRGDHQTVGDLARALSDHLGLPVDDQTALQGKYDISLTWAGNSGRSGTHAEGAWGGAGHADHGGGGAAAPAGSGSTPGEASGPALVEALQSQLGLKLVPADQTAARIFVIDHVEQLPTTN